MKARNTKNQFNIEQGTLNILVKNALAKHLDVPLEAVVTQLNREKYHDSSRPMQKQPQLEEIFLLMKTLNDTAINTSGLCSAADGTRDFVATLDNTITSIVHNFGKRAFSYLELGPEPIKTRYIINRLIQQETQIINYHGVDINPSSEKTMRAALANINFTNPIDIKWSCKDFNTLTKDDVHTNNLPVLATTLGFQEGNDHPKVLATLFDNLLKPEDLLLSEMQLYHEDNIPAIQEFYHLQPMRRFSKIALEQFKLDIQSTYQFFLLPVEINPGSPVQTAIMCEKISSGNSTTFFVSNYCLKFTSEQYQYYREASGAFKVIAQIPSGDLSIAFQLAMRVD